MGLLIEGVWSDQWYKTDDAGEFVRKSSQFRQWVSAKSDAKFKAESGRYVLYVSLACPWAHRTLIFRQLKSLQQHIDVCVVHWRMLEHGWVFQDDIGTTLDSELHSDYLWQVYTHTKTDMTGRVTVPILWDRREQCIVNNESSDITRMLNSEFDDISGNTNDYYPKTLRQEIDEVNDWIYDTINNGVYKVGFATSQRAYERNVQSLFTALEALEQRLEHERYLVGNTLTEADWRLFTTLVRFDGVYNTHFKCTTKRLTDLPNLWDYARHLYQMDGISDTVNFHHIMHHYYESHPSINPTAIVPLMPESDWMAPTKRS